MKEVITFTNSSLIRPESWYLYQNLNLIIINRMLLHRDDLLPHLKSGIQVRGHPDPNKFKADLKLIDKSNDLMSHRDMIDILLLCTHTDNHSLRRFPRRSNK
jgi:hypothetical protein